MKFFIQRFSHFCLALLLAVSCGGTAHAQDTPASLLTLANKQASLAKGQPDAEKKVAIRKSIDLYQSIPKQWPAALKECAKAHLQAATLERKLGNTEAAMDCFQEVLKVKDQFGIHAEAYLSMASLHRKKKNYAEAATCLESLLEHCANENRSCAKARLVLGSLARQQSKHLDAMQHARDVLDKHPGLWRENVDAAQLYLSILIKCHRWDEAQKELADLENKIKERFGKTDKIASVNGALAKMSAKRKLTPIPVTNN